MTILSDSSLFNPLPQDRISQTYLKILSFQTLKEGWNFGEGVPFKKNIINKAIELNNETAKFNPLQDLIKTDAFPGINGEIQITACISTHYLDFIIEPDERVTFTYEKDDIEIAYEENLSFENAKRKIGEFMENICSLLRSSTSNIITIKVERDSQVLPLEIQKKMEEFLSSTKNVSYIQETVSANILESITKTRQESIRKYPQFFWSSRNKYSLVSAS